MESCTTFCWEVVAHQGSCNTPGELWLWYVRTSQITHRNFLYSEVWKCYIYVCSLCYFLYLLQSNYNYVTLFVHYCSRRKWKTMFLVLFRYCYVYVCIWLMLLSIYLKQNDILISKNQRCKYYIYLKHHVHI